MDQNIETTISVIIRPPKDISEKILGVKKELNVFYPDHEESYPHITLYASPLAEDKYNELIKQLKSLQSAPFEVTLSPLNFIEHSTRNNTFVSIGLENISKLKSLHEKIVAIANPLRNGLIRYKDTVRRNEGRITDEQWEVTKKYGFQYFMENYNPHITIGTIEKRDIEKEALLKDKLVELEGRKFVIDTIYIKQSKRSIPEYLKTFESELTPINLVE